MWCERTVTADSRLAQPEIDITVAMRANHSRVLWRATAQAVHDAPRRGTRLAAEIVAVHKRFMRIG
jgi:hypothetical protein